MDKHKHDKDSLDRDQSASGHQSRNDAAGSGKYPSGLSEKSLDEEMVPGEPDLEQSRIEKLKEDSDLDRVR